MFGKFLGFVMFLGYLLLPPKALADQAVLVLDAANKPGLPKQFRTTSDAIPPQKNVSILGLSSLQALGSGQFSEQQLQTVMQKLNVPIMIIDLRQESHGFLNGNAISWYAKRDWGNLGKSPTEVEENQRQNLVALVEQRRVTISRIIDKDDEGGIARTRPENFTVQQIASEAELAAHYKIPYARLYVTDGWMPADVQVDRFVQIVRQLPDTSWLYFHCRAGKGRTTMFMAMYDMLRNGKSVSFEEIIKRQSLLGGKDLAKLPVQTSYKYSLAAQRIEFLKQFYQYVISNEDGFKTTWSEWNKRFLKAKPLS